MALESSPSTQFMLELYRMTQGDQSVQVATEEVGISMGLDKEAAGKISEELIGEGWVEIITLSGGIGITAAGVEAARAAGGQGPVSNPQLSIGQKPVLDQNGCTTVEALLDQIKKYLSSAQTPYAGLEEMVMDIKTLEIQMCSTQPKTAIVREVLRSLQGNLEKIGAAQIAQQLAAAIA